MDGRGLSDGYDGYLTMTESDRREVLTRGVIVLDTNVLLGLYRFEPGARAGMLNLLDAVKERLFIPNRVTFEFWRRRSSVLDERTGAASQARGEIEKALSQASAVVDHWTRRSAVPQSLSAQVQEVLREAQTRLNELVQPAAEPDDLASSADTNCDKTLARLLAILGGACAEPLSAEEKADMTAEAQRRIQQNVPPGYKDKNKRTDPDDGDPDAPLGDCLLWLETLRHAKHARCDVVLVTGDLKADWWRLDKEGRPSSPRPELTTEMMACAGTRLAMLTTTQFLEEVGGSSDKGLLLEIDRVQHLTSQERRLRPSAVVESLRFTEAALGNSYGGHVEAELQFWADSLAEPPGDDEKLAYMLHEVEHLDDHVESLLLAIGSGEREGRREELELAADLASGDNERVHAAHRRQLHGYRGAHIARNQLQYWAGKLLAYRCATQELLDAPTGPSPTSP